MNNPPIDPRWQAIADWLGTSGAYGRTDRVTLIETHISRVYLVGDRAYKLKKPALYDFLDYRTAELRRAACEAEVQLNRRLAADVYLGVVAICEANGGFSLGGPGVAVEWLVEMRRLDERDTLESRMREGRLAESDLGALIEQLAAFYRHADRPPITAEAFRAEFERHVRGNFQELSNPKHALASSAVQRICQAQLRMLVLEPDVFDGRVAEGKVVDGHGDLRPEHIYLTPRPEIIDCIEFSAEFRRLDLADELSFLEMECDRLGHGSVGRRIAETCSVALDDEPPRRLRSFYRSYRACVRAKVAALRAEQVTGGERSERQALAAQYLELADREVAALPRPLLIVVRGLMGSGKSTLARWLGERLQAPVLSTDVIRQTLFADEIAAVDQPAFNTRRYAPAQRQRVYDALFEQAATLLGGGSSVILDATFLKATNRDKASLLAQSLELTCFHIECRCSPAVAKARIAARIAQGRDASEARVELYDRQASANEPDAGMTNTYSVDSEQAISIMGQQVLKELRARATR